MQSKKTHRALVSLFTGAGGLDVGLEMAGFETRVASELEEYACETLRRNKLFSLADTTQRDSMIQELLMQRCYAAIDEEGRRAMTTRLRSRHRTPCLQKAEIISGDIRSVSSADLRHACHLLPGEELACVAGGPPCQPFSRAGKRQAVDDARNGDLFFEFVRIVRDLRPRWFIFENVKGLLLTKTELLSLACRDCHERALAPFTQRMAFGRGDTPQFTCGHCGSFNVSPSCVTRAGGSLEMILTELRRLNYRCYDTVLNAADFGAPQIRERLFIVGSRDGRPFAWPQPTHCRTRPSRPTPQQELPFGDTLASSSLHPWKSIYDALWSKGHPKYGMLDKATAQLWVKNVVRPHDEPVTWSLDRPSPTIGAHQGAKLALAPCGVPKAQLQRQQWHTKGRRQGDTPPVFVEHAYLSDEDLLRIQTFPLWWFLHGTRMQRAFQIGNAVPPVLAKAVGQAVMRADETK